MRGLLFSENYRPLFSGHETFALRQLWLKKAYDVVVNEPPHGDGCFDGAKGPPSKNMFADASAITSLGVGKNMVGSIRHWAIACDVLSEEKGALSPSPFGQQVFSATGLDPYSEHATTLWLVHWKLAGGWVLPARRIHRSATWFWVFNYIHDQTFTGQGLLKSLSEYALQRNVSISLSTLKRDIEVFLRCYVDRGEATTVDDYADSMLSELCLVSLQSRDEYSLRRGPKSTLTDGAFLCALIEFWEGFSEQNTMSFETIAYEIGSPGRVFKLDEDSVAAKLIALESLTHGDYQWSDTAGLRQIIRRRPIELKVALELAYG
jgi:hypothetical protein